MSEYARFLEGSRRDFSRPQTPQSVCTLDIVLLALIITLALTGLFVLFSASDGDWNTVARQARNFVVGFGVFLVVAQIRLILERWAPMLYLAALVLLAGAALRRW